MSEVSTKVAHNACAGGFTLSEEAKEMLIGLGVPKNFDVTVHPWFTPWADEREYILRHDPRLVQVIETLEDRAGGEYSKLVVTKVEGKVYRIVEDEYGFEKVQTPNDIAWVTVPN